MRCPNGEEIVIDDVIQLWPGCEGVVVCDLDTRTFTDAFTEQDWGYLDRGILVESKIAGLIHLEEPSADLKRLSVNTSKSP